MLLSIKGPRVTVRQPDVNDAEAYVRLFSNPANTEADAVKATEPPTIESQTKAILKWQKDAEAGKGIQMCVELDGVVIGCGGYNLFYEEDGKKVADVGILIDSSLWRKGLATSALEAIFQHAFSVKKLDIVELWTLTTNKALRAMLERSFGMIGVEKAGGPHGNNCQVRITKDMWEERSKTKPIQIQY